VGFQSLTLAHTQARQNICGELLTLISNFGLVPQATRGRKAGKTLELEQSPCFYWSFSSCWRQSIFWHVGDIWSSRTRGGTANIGIVFCSEYSQWLERSPLCSDSETGVNLAPYNTLLKKGVRVGVSSETAPKQPPMNLLVSRTHSMASVENDVTSGKLW